MKWDRFTEERDDYSWLEKRAEQNIQREEEAYERMVEEELNNDSDSQKF